MEEIFLWFLAGCSLDWASNNHRKVPLCIDWYSLITTSRSRRVDIICLAAHRTIRRQKTGSGLAWQASVRKRHISVRKRHICLNPVLCRRSKYLLQCYLKSWILLYTDKKFNFQIRTKIHAELLKDSRGWRNVWLISELNPHLTLDFFTFWCYANHCWRENQDTWTSKIALTSFNRKDFC